MGLSRLNFGKRLANATWVLIQLTAMTLRIPTNLAPAAYAISALALLALLLMCAAPANATETRSTMFVIDGSGSMWGRLDPDKRAKIDIIRDLVKAKIEGAGATNKIGFASFGHGKVGTCFDAEVISPPGDNRNAVLGPLAKLNPRGRGPLVLGLQEAIKAIGPERPASLIVIGDGADNCQQDACAAAGAIAKSVPGVAIHMIEIGVEAADTPRLSCVAKATGGTYADVKDSAALAKAIDAATELAMLTEGGTPSAQPGAPEIAPPPAGSTLKAVVTLKDGGPPLNTDVSWQIFKDYGKEPFLTGSGADISAALEAGEYDIVARHGNISARKTVSLKNGLPQVAALALGAARVALSARAVKGGEIVRDALLTLAPATATETGEPQAHGVGRDGKLDTIVAPGRYVLNVSSGAIRQNKALDLAAGDTAADDAILGAGQIVVSAAEREDGGAIEDVTFIASEDDPDSPNGKREVARSRAPVTEFSLPAGTYYVTARSGLGEARQRIAVNAGEILKRVIVLPLVPVKVSTLVAGQPAPNTIGSILRVSERDGERREILHTVAAVSELTLSPGRYRISVAIPIYRLSAVQDVVVEAGKPSAVVLKIDAAEVALKSAALSQRPDSYWEIMDSTGQAIWRSAAVEPKAIVAPGRYTVRLESRDLKTEAAFEVRDGERRQIELGAE